MSLRTAPPSFRVFATCVLATLGIGYLLALSYLYDREIDPHRKMGHGLVQGVAQSYHGDVTHTRLETVLDGKMKETIEPEEIDVFRTWIRGGATRDGYSKVAPIVAKSCATCHAAGGSPPKLVTFEDVAPLAQPGGAVSFDVLARRTHVHVFAMPLLFFVLGYFFVKTSWSERLKTVLVALPFAAVVLEIAHWWLATRFEGAALGVVVSGTAMGVGFAAQWVLTFWDLWLRRVPPAGPAGRGGA